MSGDWDGLMKFFGTKTPSGEFKGLYPPMVGIPEKDMSARKEASFAMTKKYIEFFSLDETGYQDSEFVYVYLLTKEGSEKVFTFS